MIKRPNKVWKKFIRKESKATQGKFEKLESEKTVERIVREEVSKETQGKTSSRRDLNSLLYFVWNKLVEANPHITAMNKKKLAATLAHDRRLNNAIELAAQNMPIQAAVLKQITTRALKQLIDPKCWKVFRMKKEKIQELQKKAIEIRRALSTARAKEFFRPEFQFLKDLHELNQKVLQEELGPQAEEMRKQFRLAYFELSYELEH